MGSLGKLRGAEQVWAVGLDGCHAGWIGALAFQDTVAITHTALRLFEDISAVIGWHDREAADAVIGIDVPIGLPSAVGVRECDRQARSLLGRRWMCVFQPPDRELFGNDFGAARDIVRRRRDADPHQQFHVLTKQGVQIMGKIREVDDALADNRCHERWLVEVHPEVSFQQLGGAELPKKKSAAGKRIRLGLLQPEFRDIEERLNEAQWLRRDVGYDDVLDAYAALWSALRFSRGPGHFIELGDGRRDGHGLITRMVV